MYTRKLGAIFAGAVLLIVLVVATGIARQTARTEPQTQPPVATSGTATNLTRSTAAVDAAIRRNAERMIEEGRRTFRYDTFGDEAFWAISSSCIRRSSVDDAVAPGIGHRLDGWPNRDLNVGAIVALAPTLKPFSDLLGVDAAGVRAVLKSWGPGKYDAELVQDFKAKSPQGRSGATCCPRRSGWPA